VTKAEVIELVLLRVSGGKLSPDIVVRREDIAAMFPAVFSFVISQDKARKEDIREFRVVGPGAMQNLATFTSTLITPTQGDPYYYMEPVAANDTGDWVARVASKSGPEYVKVRSASDVQSSPLRFPVFWTEGRRVYIFNQELNCELRVTYQLDPSGFADDDDIPFPDGGEAKVIDLLCAHFEKQRVNPTDYRTNDHDVKEQQG